MPPRIDAELQSALIARLLYFRDLGIYDDICLEFRVDGGWFAVSEDADGWPELRTAVSRHFPNMPRDWHEAVMLPPFEPCRRVLYERV